MRKVAMQRANDVLGQTCAYVDFDYADDLVRDKRAHWIIRHNGYNPFNAIRLTKAGEDSMARFLKLHDTSCSPGESVMDDFVAGKAYAAEIVEAYAPRWAA